MYKLLIAKKAEKELENLSKETKEYTRLEILKLKDFPGVTSDIKKLKRGNKLFRLRKKQIRVIFEVSKAEKMIRISHIKKRNERTYKNL